MGPPPAPLKETHFWGWHPAVSGQQPGSLRSEGSRPRSTDKQGREPRPGAPHCPSQPGLCPGASVSPSAKWEGRRFHRPPPTIRRKRPQGTRGDSGQEGAGSLGPPHPRQTDTSGTKPYPPGAHSSGMSWELSRSPPAPFLFSWGQEGPLMPSASCLLPLPGESAPDPRTKAAGCPPQGVCPDPLPAQPRFLTEAQPHPRTMPQRTAWPQSRKTPYAARIPGSGPWAVLAWPGPPGSACHPVCTRKWAHGSCPGAILRTPPDKGVLRAQTRSLQGPHSRPPNTSSGAPAPVVSTAQNLPWSSSYPMWGFSTPQQGTNGPGFHPQPQQAGAP